LTTEGWFQIIDIDGKVLWSSNQQRKKMPYSGEGVHGKTLDHSPKISLDDCINTCDGKNCNAVTYNTENKSCWTHIMVPGACKDIKNKDYKTVTHSMLDCVNPITCKSPYGFP